MLLKINKVRRDYTTFDLGFQSNTSQDLSRPMSEIVICVSLVMTAVLPLYT